ncbi:MAG: PIN domain-containing protein [Deltaproteobacteria bacterium]|nr:PIN domain-containing protein [Deltaproteobacteria bacterium]
MSRIFWDTNLFIYLFEGHGARSDRVAALRERMLKRNDQLCTSTLTLGEVLVKPLEREDDLLRRRYEEALSTAAVLIPFDRDAARIYATVRRDRTIRAPDAVQLACAAQARVDLFITNDDRLSRCTVPGIQFISSLDRAFL